MCLHFHVASACVLGFGTSLPYMYCRRYFSAEDGGEERERGRREEEEEEEDLKEKKEATTNNHVDIAQQYNNRAMEGSWLS